MAVGPETLLPPGRIFVGGHYTIAPLLKIFPRFPKPTVEPQRLMRSSLNRKNTALRNTENPNPKSGQIQRNTEKSKMAPVSTSPPILLDTEARTTILHLAAPTHGVQGDPATGFVRLCPMKHVGAVYPSARPRGASEGTDQP